MGEAQAPGSMRAAEREDMGMKWERFWYGFGMVAGRRMAVPTANRLCASTVLTVTYDTSPPEEPGGNEHGGVFGRPSEQQAPAAGVGILGLHPRAGAARRLQR